MKVLIDTNVLLDVCLSRQPYAVASAMVWEAAENRRIDAVVAAISLTNLHYVLRKIKDKPPRTRL